MKKIMFNDKYGLTQAVLECRKTQTRRILLPHTVLKLRSGNDYQEAGWNGSVYERVKMIVKELEDEK